MRVHSGLEEFKVQVTSRLRQQKKKKNVCPILMLMYVPVFTIGYVTQTYSVQLMRIFKVFCCVVIVENNNIYYETVL